MVYRWKIELILNSGEKLVGYTRMQESNSHEVATTLWNKKDDSAIIGFNNEDGTAAIYVRVKEIASMSIYAI